MIKQVVFLDFDGVLNTGNYQKLLKTEGKESADEFGLLFDPQAIANLRIIIETIPTAAIVVNSTWKFEGLDWVKSLWKKRGLPGVVHSVTPCYVFDFSKMSLDDISLAMEAQKGYDIKQWLMENTSGRCNYVILEDDARFLPDQLQHLVLVDGNVGISEENAKAAIRILQEQ